MERPLLARPSKATKAILRIPVLLYSLGLADRLAERQIILLYTTGRRTGQQRVSGVNYVADGQTIYLAAGWGPRSGWYQNLLANPAVSLRVGGRRVTGIARQVTDPDEKRKAGMMIAALDRGGPPKPLRPILRRFGVDYDGELAAVARDPGNLTLAAIELAQPLPAPRRSSADERKLWMGLAASTLGLAALFIALTRRGRRR